MLGWAPKQRAVLAVLRLIRRQQEPRDSDEPPECLTLPSLTLVAIDISFQRSSMMGH